MKLAAIATMYQRHDKTLPLLEAVLGSSRRPDELWIMCEGLDDAKVAADALDALKAEGIAIVVLKTPRVNENYAVIPYSHKINWVLSRTSADVVCYIDNNSIPSQDKYRVMLEALEKHPDWGAVYCSQQRSGIDPKAAWADSVLADAYAIVNYTQVMHRKTDDRWTENMAHANPDLADALFWRSLHKTLGAFHPVDAPTIHDWHHIPSHAAQGL